MLKKIDFCCVKKNYDVMKLRAIKSALRPQVHDSWPSNYLAIDEVYRNTESKYPPISRDASITADDFRRHFEMSPAICQGLVDTDVMGYWKMNTLCLHLGSCVVQCGEDCAGNELEIQLRLFVETYMNYCDDRNPMLVFDSIILESVEVQEYLKKSGFVFPGIFKDQDFMKVLSPDSRPPHEWLIIGPARSGSPIHTDPFATHAWNALLEGRKRWVVFHPNTPLHLLRIGLTQDSLSEAFAWDDIWGWFNEEIPDIKADVDAYFQNECDENQFWCFDFIQEPGEIVFMPSRWHHAVINLTDTVAITQNYCSETNLRDCVGEMSDPILGREFIESMQLAFPKLMLKNFGSNELPDYYSP